MTPGGRRAATWLVVAGALLDCGDGASEVGAATVRVHAPTKSAGATVAKVVVSTVARLEPGRGDVVVRVPTATSWGDGPQQLLVLGERAGPDGRRWLRVLLPVRPNGTVGWIRADHVLLGTTPYWLEISLDRRVVSVYRSGSLVRRFRAVIGARETPTPPGLHAIYDPIAQPDPRAFLGPWVIHLTAFSDVLDDFGGGPGRVAIHGRSGASLRDPLGTARSHGCVRVDNSEVGWLARTLPRGTPVRIVG